MIYMKIGEDKTPAVDVSVTAFIDKFFNPKDSAKAGEAWKFRPTDYEKGGVPSENDFNAAVAYRYTLDHDKDDFNPVEFEDEVRAMYNAIKKRIYTEQTPAIPLQKKIIDNEIKVKTFETALVDQSLVITNLNKIKKRIGVTAPEKMADELKAFMGVLDKEIGKEHPRITFRQHAWPKPMNLEGIGTKGKMTEEEEEAEQKAWDTLHEQFGRVPMFRENDMKKAWENLEKYVKGAEINVSDVMRSLAVVMGILEQDRRETEANYKKALAEAKSLDAKLDLIKTAPPSLKIRKQITKPIINNPFLDADSFMKILEDMDKPVVREVPVRRMNEWLLDMKYLPNLFKNLKKSPGETLHTWDIKRKKEADVEAFKKKTDIHNVETSIMELVGHMANFVPEINRVVGKIDEAVNEEEALGDDGTRPSHMLTPLLKNEHEAISNMWNKLKDKYDDKTFMDLTKWDDNRETFIVDKIALPEKAKADRDHMDKLVEALKARRNENNVRYQSKWKPIENDIDAMKKHLSNIKSIFSSVMDEDWFKKWQKGGTPGPYMRPEKAPVAPTASFPYEVVIRTAYTDPSKTFATIKENVSTLKDFLKEHHLYSVASEQGKEAPAGLKKDEVEQFRVENRMKSRKIVEQFLKETPEVIMDFLNKVGTKLTQLETGIDRYYEAVNNAIMDIAHGVGIKIPKKAFSYQVESDFIRRYAYFLKLAEVAPFKSEYPVQVPLADIRKNPEIYWDYFQKSFPIEEILNEWKKMSGSEDTLDSKMFPKVIDRLMGYLEAHTKKVFDPTKLKEETGKLTEERDAILERRNRTMKQLELAKQMARDESEMTEKMLKDTRDEIKHSAVTEWTKLNQALKINKDQFENALTGLTEAVDAMPFKKDVADKYEKEVKQHVAEISGITNKIINVLDEINRDTVGGWAESNTIKDKLEYYMGEIQHKWSGQGVRLLNRLDQDKDREVELSGAIGKRNKWLELGGPTSKDKKRIKNEFIRYIWNVLDEDWTRKLRAFQTHYNLNFEDYVEIHDQVARMVSGEPVPARSYNRLRDDIKKQMRDLRDRGEEIPATLKKEIKMLSERQRYGLGEAEKKKGASEESVNLPLSFRLAKKFLSITLIPLKKMVEMAQAG